ncbi:bet1 [Anaeramoeba flamelloides]|uniref:Bet1 n=1 Tax=Anaeramoeba flamelloides TaxID=1746091 RepID=A0ABQ8Y7W3_9EUKA|nr:bet1 [Anaeramoeba flamelloides]
MTFKRTRQPNYSNNKSFNYNYLQQQNKEIQKQNELKIKTLKNKVIGIKSISVDIRNEIRRHNKLLDELDNNFNSANSILDRTVNRISTLISSTTGQHMCWLFLFVFTVLIFIYFYWKINLRK